MRKIAFVLICVSLVAALGCAPGIQELQKRNTMLTSELETVKGDREKLATELEECNEYSGTLSREKQAIGVDISSLRVKTRRFLRGQFDGLNDFSKNEELMDYMGGELIERSSRSGSDITVVNLTPISTNSVIFMVKGLFEEGTVIKPKLLRQTEDGFVCVWEGEDLIAAGGSGVVRLELATPLNALEGDLFGVFFPGLAAVSFDEKTGSYAVYPGEVKMGAKLPGYPKAKLRNYSMGVAGLFD